MSVSSSCVKSTSIRLKIRSCWLNQPIDQEGKERWVLNPNQAVGATHADVTITLDGGGNDCEPGNKSLILSAVG